MPVMLPQKTPTETKVITWNFSTNLSPKTFLQDIIIVIKGVVTGNDPGAVGLIVGQAVIMPDSPYVAALVDAGLDGVSYSLFCAARANNGERHEILLTLPVSVNAI